MIFIAICYLSVYIYVKVIVFEHSYIPDPLQQQNSDSKNDSHFKNINCGKCIYIFFKPKHNKSMNIQKINIIEIKLKLDVMKILSSIFFNLRAKYFFLLFLMNIINLQ